MPRNLFVTVDGGHTWRVDDNLDRRLPNRAAEYLSFSPDGSALYSASYCSGSWRAPWPW